MTPVPPPDDPFVPDYSPVLAALRERIIDATYPPGELLSERGLADEFGVSRLPVRQALEELAVEELITLGTGRVPSRVRAIDETEASELYDVVATLDTLAVRLAATRHSPAELDRLAELCVEERRLYDAGVEDRRLLDTIFEFRQHVHTMAANSVIPDIDQVVNSRLRILVSHLPFAETLLRAHQLLYDAIADRDPDLAEAIMREMFENGQRRHQVVARTHHEPAGGPPGVPRHR